MARYHIMSHSESTDSHDFEWKFYDQQQFDNWLELSSDNLSPETESFIQDGSESPDMRSDDTKLELLDEESASDEVEANRCSGKSTSQRSKTAAANKRDSNQPPQVKHSPVIIQRRRTQNRTAQRAFRARQKQHTEALEEKMRSVLVEYESLQQEHTLLCLAHQKLRDERWKGQTHDSGDWDVFGDAARVELGCERGEMGLLGSGAMVWSEKGMAWKELDHELGELVAATWGTEGGI